MKTLIIYAHPDTGGHCPQTLDYVLDYHRDHKIAYELLDLYQMKYDPVMHENEHYTAGEGHRVVSKQNKEIQEKITATDRLIFIHPVWWNSMPAILKGFIDKVFVSHFAFKYVPMPIIGAAPRPLLKGKKAVVFQTTGGPWWAWLVFQRRRARKQMKTDMLGFFGIKSSVYRYGPARQLDDRAKAKIKNMVEKGLGRFY